MILRITTVILLWLFADGGSTSYVLPYEKGTTHKILQAYNGPWGPEGHAAFAYDFEMPIGTPVHAARSGNDNNIFLSTFSILSSDSKRSESCARR